MIRNARSRLAGPTASGSFVRGVVLILVLVPAVAIAVSDDDGDLVPNAFDNCSTTPNGPNDASNQVDSDLDGYGNACDADYSNDQAVTGLDYATFLATVAGPGDVTDHDGNGIVTLTDFNVYLSYFAGLNSSAPGPSGLACAGTVPCVP